MDNKEVAKIFYQIADILELDGDNPFRIRAYRNAARNINALSRELEDLFREDPELPWKITGVGKDLKDKIKELIGTGSLGLYEDLIRRVPGELLSLLDLEGLGVKRLKKLREKLGIENMTDLKEACRDKRVQGIEGMGQKTEQKLLESINHYRKSKGRMLLPEAEGHKDRIIDYLKRSSVFKKITFAGSLRRGRETVGDIDILASVSDTGEAMNYFISFPSTERIVAEGPSKSSIRIKNGPQIDLRVVEEEAFPAAMIYFTGSTAHNVAIRKVAKKKGYRLNEYGLFRMSSGKADSPLSAGSEEEIYQKLGMQAIPPELRENSGEVEAAFRRGIPENLVRTDDIRGELHVHSQATDGQLSLEELISEADRMGYDYFAVTDHTSNVRVAGGLDSRGMKKHIQQIRKTSSGLDQIELLAGAEVDILKTGKLDLPEEILKDLDVVIAAVHSNFSLSKEDQTERILKAMDNEYVNVLAHPTCRLIGKRRPIDLDMEKIFKKAKEKKIYLEINSQAERMDLNDIHCRRAQGEGVKFVISTDVHRTRQMDLIKYGIMLARRGWVLADNVLNAYFYDDLMRALAKRSY